MPKMSIAGYDLSIQKQQGQDENFLTTQRMRTGAEILDKYREGKQALETKIVENEQWYKTNHWNLTRGKVNDTGEPEPTTSYLFNTLANKHADAMDNFPEPNFFAVEKSDVEEAKMLTSIVPLVLEKNNYEQTYDRAWWYKLKQGTSVKGIFWNPELENGLGGIDIVKLDLLNMYWETGVENIQKSPNLFITNLVNNDTLKEQYPELLEDFTGSKVVMAKEYVQDDKIDTDEKSVVVDWYYKKYDKDLGKEVIHMTKFIDEIKLESTEDNPEYKESGIYEHGLYPFVFDVLFPEENMPVGFGYIDIAKNPQMYIDKLDQIISRNALQSGKKRFLVKRTGNINIDDLNDWGKDVVETDGSVDDASFREIQTSPLAPFIINHRMEKINELKETSGVNDASRGETGGGVTAASAIAALQEAGSKLSRDMIKGSYNAYKQEIFMVIELIRQFYTEDRNFRITGEDGKDEFVQYNSANIQPQEMAPSYEGEEPKYRSSVFDIKVKPQKKSPFSTMAHNELAKELFGAGFFSPEMSIPALVALKMMTFEGKEQIIEEVRNNGQMMQQMQQMAQQLEQLQQQNVQMAEIIQKTTGQDLGIGGQQNG